MWFQGLVNLLGDKDFLKHLKEEIRKIKTEEKYKDYYEEHKSDIEYLEEQIKEMRDTNVANR